MIVIAYSGDDITVLCHKGQPEQSAAALYKAADNIMSVCGSISKLKH